MLRGQPQKKQELKGALINVSVGGGTEMELKPSQAHFQTGAPLAARAFYFTGLHHLGLSVGVTKPTNISGTWGGKLVSS